MHQKTEQDFDLCLVKTTHVEITKRAEGANDFAILLFLIELIIINN